MIRADEHRNVTFIFTFCYGEFIIEIGKHNFKIKGDTIHGKNIGIGKT